MSKTAQDVLNALDIYDAGNDLETSAEGNKAYIDFINSLDGAASGTVSDFLDRLGRLYNLRRTFFSFYNFNKRLWLFFLNLYI